MGLGTSNIASSSLGDRKNGRPKRKTLWELTLALIRFLINLTFLFGFRELGDFFGEMCSVRVSLVFDCLFVRGFLLYHISFLFVRTTHKNKNNNNNKLESGGQRVSD